MYTLLMESIHKVLFIYIYIYILVYIENNEIKVFLINVNFSLLTRTHTSSLIVNTVVNAKALSRYVV